jgi:hypothetical protein
MTLSNFSMKWFLSLESDNINLYEITIFCCLKSISEYINGFNMMKNPWGTQFLQK